MQLCYINWICHAMECPFLTCYYNIIIYALNMRETFNPLMGTGNYSAHRIIRSWYTGRWWVGCYIWYSEEGTGRAAAPPSLLLAVPNVTAHPSTASVPITVLLYDGPLLCAFNVAIKGLTWPKYCQLLQGPHEMPEKTTTIIIITNNNMK